MKKSLLILFFLSVACSLSAQDLKRQHEVGLRMGRYANGLSYKIGNERSLWRFNTLLISGLTTNDIENDGGGQDSKNMSFSFHVGKEFRRGLTEDFELRYGADVGLGFSERSNRVYTSENLENNEWLTEMSRISYGLDAVISLNYLVNDKLVIGLEVTPGISYHITDQRGAFARKSKDYAYGLDTNDIFLSIAFRL